MEYWMTFDPKIALKVY